MMLTRSGTIVAGLLLMNGLLLAAVAYEFTDMDASNMSAAVAAQSPSGMPKTTQTEPAVRRAIDSYNMMLSRPLFNQDRMPLQNDGPDEEDASALSLIGVVLTPEQQVAIIYSKNQNRPVKLALWEWVDGWRLVEVEAEGVVLRKGSRSLALSLQRTSQVEAE